MPKPTELSAYPRSYLELIQYFFSGDAKPEMVLEFESHRAAAAYRFDLYGFRKALAVEGHPLAREAKSLRMTVSSHPSPLRDRSAILTISHVQSLDDPISTALNSLGVQTLTAGSTNHEPSDIEIAAEHDETDEQLSTADEQAGLIANFFKDK